MNIENHCHIHESLFAESLLRQYLWSWGSTKVERRISENITRTLFHWRNWGKFCRAKIHVHFYFFSNFFFEFPTVDRTLGRTIPVDGHYNSYIQTKKNAPNLHSSFLPLWMSPQMIFANSIFAKIQYCLFKWLISPFSICSTATVTRAIFSPQASVGFPEPTHYCVHTECSDCRAST